MTLKTPRRLWPFPLIADFARGTLWAPAGATAGERGRAAAAQFPAAAPQVDAGMAPRTRSTGGTSDATQARRLRVPRRPRGVVLNQPASVDTATRPKHA